jgi:hypothetical protein
VGRNKKKKIIYIKATDMPYNTITSGFISKKLLSFFSFFKHCGILVRGFMKDKEWMPAQKGPRDCFVNEEGLMLGISLYRFFSF